MFFHLREDLRLPDDADCFEDYVDAFFEGGTMVRRPGEKYECRYVWAGNGVFAMSAVPLFESVLIVFIPVEGGFPFIPNSLSKFRNSCLVFTEGCMSEFFAGVNRVRNGFSALCKD